MDEAVERREWQVFVSLLLTFSTRESVPNKLVELQQKMLQGGVVHVMVDAPGESDENFDDAERAKEVAKRTYERSVAVTKEVVNSVRMGRSANQ